MIGQSSECRPARSCVLHTRSAVYNTLELVENRSNMPNEVSLAFVALSFVIIIFSHFGLAYPFPSQPLIWSLGYVPKGVLLYKTLFFF